MKQHSVLILGGSGFIGSAVAEQLTKLGHTVTVPTRDRERAKHLLLLPTCEVVAANVHDDKTLDALIAQHDVVINLVGILRGDFERAHVTFAKRVAERCKARGVNRLIHMSALNADANGPSEYLKSRGRGEAAVWAAVKDSNVDVTVFQPSVVFGERDNFINMLRGLIDLFPVIPLGSPNAKFQVVWVEDVARAIVQSIDMLETIGKTYPLVGPTTYTMRELVDFVMKATGKSRLVIGMGYGLSMLQALVFELPPMSWFAKLFLNVTLTRDNVRSMQRDAVSATPFPAIFGAPSSMEAVTLGYLKGISSRARYNTLRQGTPD
jgi:uncharacterized protein YbjT (DUF2867 family)